MLQKPLFTTAFIGAAFVGLSPAFADLSPNQALERYFDLSTSMGAELSVGLKEELNGVVRWRDVVISNDIDGAVSTSTLDWIEAAPENKDTVKITIGPKAFVETVSPDASEPPINFEMKFKDNEIFVSEEGELLNWTYAMDQVTMQSISADQNAPFDMTVTMNDMTGRYELNGETYLEGGANFGSIEMEMMVDEDDTQGNILFNASSAVVDFSADLPENEDYSGYLTGEKNANLTYKIADYVWDTNFNSPDDGNVAFRASTGLSAGTLTVQEGAIAILGETQDIAYAIQPPIPGMPQMNASAKGMNANGSITIGKPGEVAPMAMALSIEDLVLDDAIWGMFDPTGAIPRDPASLRLDFSADALWLTDDFMSSAESGEPPLMPQSLELSELFLTVGGASITASGSGVLSAETGVPSGAGTLELRGVLGLIQTMSQAGLIPVPQAMMAQGMLPQFTRPGDDGSDHLISDLEARPDGSIYVNGTRVK